MTAIAELPAGATGGPRLAGHSRPRRVLGTLGNALGWLLLAAAALVLLGLTVGPRVFHYRTATMLTGSMVPTIKPGDVVVDTEENATALKVGQIISYHIPVDDHRVESHRVTWVHVTKSGAVLFRTKGDANNGADPWTARSAPHTKVWTVKTVLPAVGTVIRFLRLPVVQLALTRALPALLVLIVLISIWRPSRRDPSEAA
jgi:signal peptidase